MLSTHSSDDSVPSIVGIVPNGIEMVGAVVFVGMGGAVGSGLGTGVFVTGGGDVDVGDVSVIFGMGVFAAASFCGADCWQAQAINVKMTNIRRVNKFVILKKRIVIPP